MNPVSATSNASRAFLVPLGGGVLPSQHRTPARADVLDQRLESASLRFRRAPNVVRFLRDDVEIVDDVRRRRNVKRDDVVQGLLATGDGPRVARLTVQRGQSRLVRGTGAGTGLLRLDGLQFGAELGVLFLQLPQQTALGFHLGNGRLGHALVDRRDKVVQRN